MLELDWVAWWKVITVVLTGAFGILGLLTTYKDSNGIITKWGKISLAGILLSTLLGAIAQIKELSDKELAAKNSRETILKLVEKTEHSVSAIERTLEKIDEATTLKANFYMRCDGVFIKLCESIARTPRISDQSLPGTFMVFVVIDKRERHSFGPQDWIFHSDFVSEAVVKSDGKNINLIFSSRIAGQENIGVFKSFLDLPNAAMTVRARWLGDDQFPLQPLTVEVIFKNGRRIFASEFKETSPENGNMRYRTKINLDVN